MLNVRPITIETRPAGAINPGVARNAGGGANAARGDRRATRIAARPTGVEGRGQRSI